MKHKQNDLIITDEFFKDLPKPTIVESPSLADERIKFCAEINRLNRENEELREALRDVLTYHEDEPWVPAWRLLGVDKEC